jgi:hypothetical protein
MTLLEDLMQHAKKALQRLHAASEADASQGARDFSVAIGDIGRRIYLVPGNVDKVRAFVADTADAVIRSSVIDRMLGSVVDAAEPFNGEPDLYVKALNMRSDLEFFRDLYRDSAAREWVEAIDIEDTDAALERLAPHYYIAETPSDIPPHHVWWQRHAKAPPPAR